MVEPLAAAYGTTNERTTILVRVRGEGVEGWGECIAFREPTYMADWSNGEYLVLTEMFIPALMNAREVTAASVSEILSNFKGHHTAKAALELAVLDAELRLAQTSLVSYFGASASRVECTVVVGLVSGDALVRSIDQQINRGYRQIKLKIAPGRDVERIDLVQNRFPELSLQVDANCSYDWANLEHRAALIDVDKRNLTFLEQPLLPGNARAYFQMREALHTRIALDEAVVSYTRAVDVLDLVGCDAFVLKPGLLGGYLTAKEVHDECLKRDVATMVGGMLETGIARAANLALAALPGFSRHPAEIAPDGRWFHESVLKEPVDMINGKIAVPTTPGIGVDVDLPIVNRFTRRSHIARASR
jgi:O-succinylbenzoate synthase